MPQVSVLITPGVATTSKGVPHAGLGEVLATVATLPSPQESFFFQRVVLFGFFGDSSGRKRCLFFGSMFFGSKLLLRTLVTTEEPTPGHCDVYC